jgi:hypothetical protein
MFSMQAGFDATIEIRFRYFAAGKTSMGGINYDAANNRWLYMNNAAAWVIIPGGTQVLERASSVWHWLKFVFDVSTNRYIYLKCNETIYDLRGFSFWAGAAGASQFLDIWIGVKRGAAANDRLLKYDSIIFTEE